MPTISDFVPAAILFDCAGALLLTADLHFDVISGAAAAQGASMPRDLYMSLTGLWRRDLFARFADEFALALDMPRLTTDSIALTVGMAGQVRENPAVTALARAGAGRLPIALVTNSEAMIANAFLAVTDLGRIFDAIITVERASAPKPAPDLYLPAADVLGVATERCLALEDSSQGIESATRAGSVCVDVREAEWASSCSVFLKSGLLQAR
jgi:beta-phosphoglucomutase-like phosphatase (HAD superfamily)